MALNSCMEKKSEIISRVKEVPWGSSEMRTMVIGEENEVKRGLFIFFKVKELREYCMLLEVI